MSSSSVPFKVRIVDCEAEDFARPHDGGSSGGVKCSGRGPTHLQLVRVMGKDKTHINIVVIGHVESGSSDNTGHLIDKLGVTNGKFETTNYYCSIVDAPELAHCAVLVIDSTTSVSILSKDELIGHTLRALALGRQKLICCCDEMQAALSKDSYDEIVSIASSYLESLGHNHNKISFVPISSSKVNNMIEISTNHEWYKGPTLHQAIDQIYGPKRRFREECCHKSQLQQFSLKNYRKYPVYITRSEGEPHDCKFCCTIEVDDQHFQSVQFHVHKKEAEQDAARVAYEFLKARNGDNFADVLALIDKDLILYKTILYEFTCKKETSQPSYSYHRQKGPGRMTFNVATVSVDGKEYIGEIARSKKVAAEKAARLAVMSILDTNHECMLNIFRSKRRLVTRYSLYMKEELPNFPCVSSVPSNQPSEKHTTKTLALDPEAPDQLVGRVDVQSQHPAPDPEAPPGLVASS